MTVLAALAGCATPTTPADLPPAVPVFFQSWSAALDASALNAIATAASVAKANPTDDVLVTGAADSVGSSQANIYISQTRAQVVADQLVADGVSRDRIKTKGAGEVPTMAPNGSPAQIGRRVLIQVGG
jgi:outer membrane protein OmpA-like peptidoglycan-associated protein